MSDHSYNMALRRVNQDAAKRLQEPVDEQLLHDPEELGWWDSVLANEATLVAQDVGRHTWTATKNVASSALGLPADVVQLMADVRFSSSGIEAPAIPGTSEDFAELLGGDVTHPSWLPAAIIAPGPGEIGALKSLIAGATVAPRVGRVARLEEFKNMEVPTYDKAAYEQTGWYKGEDGMARFYISDADATIAPIEDLLAKGNYTGSEGVVNLPLSDVLSHTELYKTYPELAKFPISISWIKTDDGIKIINSARPGTHASLRIGQSGTTRNLKGIEVNNITDAKQFRTTVLHEVQHVIQELEGFGVGGSASARVSDLNRLTAKQATSVAFDAIDAGAANPDDLAQALMFEFHIDEAGVDELLRSGDVAAYLAGSENFRLEYRQAFSGEVAKLQDRVVGMLDFLLIDNEAKGMEYLEAIREVASTDAMSNLSFRAYENLYGEAEARLIEDLADKTMAQLKELGPVPPQEATRLFPQDVEIPLSIKQPTQTVKLGQVATESDFLLDSASSREALEETLRDLSDNDLIERLQGADPKSPTWQVAVDWFGEARLIELGLLE